MKRRPSLPKPTAYIYLNKWYNPYARAAIYIILIAALAFSLASYKTVTKITTSSNSTKAANATLVSQYAATLVAEITSTALYVSLHPTATKTITVTPKASPTKIILSCESAPIPHVRIGQTVTVLVENYDKLKLRSEPRISQDTVITELNKFTKLEILDGPECVAGVDNTMYWFWKVRVTSTNKVGWVAEGQLSHYYID